MPEQKPKGKPDVKEIVGENVRAPIKAREKDFDSACARLGVKPTQLKRIMKGDHAVTMTTIQRIAAAYDLEPYQLLVPGLDANNPQVLRALGPAEEKLYQVFEEALTAAKKGTQ